MSDEITRAARAAALDAFTKALDPVLTAVSEEAANAAIRASKEQTSDGSVPARVKELVQELAEQVSTLESELSSIRYSISDWESAKDQLSEIDEYIVNDAESSLSTADTLLTELGRELGEE
jgi:predicted  nucleic acid-binding Zn-ribbon protein